MFAVQKHIAGKYKKYSRDSRKTRNRDKGRRTGQYFLKKINEERNKQTKKRFDSYRIASEPSEEEEQMDQMFADHFFGQKSCMVVYNS